MKESIMAGAGLVLAVPLLAACGSATAANQVSADRLPEPAPAAFGKLDVTGDTLQCSTELWVDVVSDVDVSAVGAQTPDQAANSFIQDTTSHPDEYLASTATKLVAAGAVAPDGEYVDGGETNTVQVNATNAEGRIVGIVFVSPIVKGGGWAGTRMFLCDGGSTK